MPETKQIDITVELTENQELIMMLEEFLKRKYEIRRNIIRDIIEIRNRSGTEVHEFRPLTKEAFNSIVIDAMKDGIEGNFKSILEQLVYSDNTPEYDPAKDFLSNLPAWDGQDRIEPLFYRLPGITAEQVYFAARWLRSCVAHWLGMDSMYGNQTVLMLVGSQGLKKTAFFKNLLPEHLQLYFLDHLNLSNKFDKEMALSNNLLVNIDEIDQVTNSQQAALKQTITKSSVNGRRIFGRTQQDRSRVASFTATTNNPHPLKDPTGSRRFLCIKITDEKQIDIDSPIDYEQLYSQLVYEVTVEKQIYWFSLEESRRIQQLNRRFYNSNDLELIISSCFRKPMEGDTPSSLTSSQILQMISTEYPDIKNNRSMQTRLGTTMTALGFERRHSEKGNVYSLVSMIA